MKMVQRSQNGLKHYGKKENCSLRAISPFPSVFSKDLYCRHVKQGLVWKRVNHLLGSTFSDICALTALNMAEQAARQIPKGCM